MINTHSSSAVWRVRRTVLGLVFVFVLGACSNELDARLQAAVDSPEDVSPLDFLVGVSSADGPSSDADAQAQVAECMGQAGFVYVASTTGDELASASGPFSAPSLEEVRTLGYGVAQDLSDQLAELGGEIVDPNDALRETLSAEELKAYDAALSGISDDEILFGEDGAATDAQTGEPAAPEQIEAAASDGCLYQAYATSSGAAASRLLSSDVYREVQDRLMSDPLIVELTGAWSGCMRSNGYSYQSQGAIFEELYGASDNVFHEATEDHHELTATEIAELVDQLRADEIEIALVDYRCSEELFEAAPRILRRIEREFIQSNESRLLDLLDQDS